MVEAVISLLGWWKPQGHPILEQDFTSVLYENIIKSRWSMFNTTEQDIITQYARTLANALISTYINPALMLNPLSGQRYADDVQYNNFHSIRISSVCYLGMFLKDEDLLDWSYEQLLLQINNNLNDDGTSFDLEHRDSLGYHVYNVKALLKAALMLQSHPKYANEVNLYSHSTKKSNSIKCAIHYLFPYIRGEKIHYMLVNSHLKSDKNSKNYGVIWTKEDAKWLLYDASKVDKEALDIYQQVWGVVNKNKPQNS